MPAPLFTPFRRLPPELRLKIWKHALAIATAGRMIRVAVCHELQVMMHACVTGDGQFCGNHGHCPRYVQGASLDCSNCMADGYFCSHDAFPEPEDPASREALQSLCLACRESRGVVTSSPYARQLRVYRRCWHPEVQSKLVRSDPASDTLLVLDVPDMSRGHRPATPSDESLAREATPSQPKDFPGDQYLFRRFRDALSSFERVAFRYEGLQRTDRRNEFVTTPDFAGLLFFLDSMKALYAWPDPRFWADVIANATVDDVGSLAPPEEAEEAPAVSFLAQQVEDLIGDYRG
ncbi:hypothetical protein JDV02_005570 [Purpureocillium takamizusanense]|uniref:2EXR domain-containing protein n=1 Tax=Purpureocillium takamizusanense TaxID=2060973 RepID=A0A9Q8VAG9_9HYPO|nr:uncharacterized protein JDV02_005570 [Purpureocillium takamizusanense]UNI19385.1 hypothetical protein JDV02_005570 [Purpureocillium takamizusanense]